MRFILFSILMVSLLSFRASAQNIEIREDASVQEIMDFYKRVNKGKPYIEGWRVQILSTVDRQQFESVRANFKAQYPYITTSWVHNRPYYKLRAGAFASKLEALRLQSLLKMDYPSAYPAVDNEIRPEEIIGGRE